MSLYKYSVKPKREGLVLDVSKLLSYVLDPSTVYMVDHMTLQEYVLRNGSILMSLIKHLHLEKVRKPHVYDLIWKLMSIKSAHKPHEMLERLKEVTERTSDPKAIFEHVTSVEYVSLYINLQVYAICPDDIFSKIQGIYPDHLEFAPYEYLSHIISEQGKELIKSNDLSANFIKNLDTKLGPLAEEFKQKLVESEAVIAGGFAANSITGSVNDSSDIDIYVTQDNYIPIMDFMFRKKSSIYEGKYNFSSAYDSSFFMRNGILARFEFRVASTGLSIDVMIVKKDRDLLDVVRNFDFTFCQVWYDFKRMELSGTNIELTMQKRGFLNPDYLAPYMEKNRFTLGRLSKYEKRGFEIEIVSQTLVHHDKRFPEINHVILTWLMLDSKDLFKLYTKNIHFFELDIDGMIRYLINNNSDYNLVEFLSEIAENTFKLGDNPKLGPGSAIKYKTYIRQLNEFLPSNFK